MRHVGLLAEILGFALGAGDTAFLFSELNRQYPNPDALAAGWGIALAAFVLYVGGREVQWRRR